jgi:hypothetical protein
MWPFRRRQPRGKHALGAAVTSIPSGLPPRVAAPVAVVPEQVVTAEPVVAEMPQVPVQAPAPRAPRVELGFRDGTSAALAPGSEQATALQEIASVLTRRD